MQWTLRKLLEHEERHKKPSMDRSGRFPRQPMHVNCRSVTVEITPKMRLEGALLLLSTIQIEEMNGPAMLTSIATARRALQQAVKRAE